MKFVCERCQTKYSIADEKVRGKVLKVRCKSCSNVITVREPPLGAVKATDASIYDSGRTSITSPAELQRRHAEATRAMEGAKVQTAPQRTRSGPLAAIPSEALSAPGTPKVPPPAFKAPPPSEDPIWYLAVDGHQTGPFTASVLVDKVLAQPKAADVHVWNAGLGHWRPPAAVPEIHALVEKRRRPVAPPPPPLSSQLRKAPGSPAAPASFGASSAAATPMAASAGAAVAEKQAHVAPVMPSGRSAVRKGERRAEIARAEAPLPTSADLDEILQDKPSRKTGRVPATNGLSHHADLQSDVRAESAGDLQPLLPSGDAAAPTSALTETESDALAALSLSRPSVPSALSGSSATAAAAATNEVREVKEVHAKDELTRGTASEAFFAKAGPAVGRPTTGSEFISGVARRHRNVKLVFGLAAVVVVVCSVFALSTMRKPGNVANAEKPKIRAGGTDFAKLASDLAQEQANSPRETTEATTTETKIVSVGRVPVRDPRRTPGHAPSTRGILPTAGTSPPPLADMSPDQKSIAERLRGRDAREERIPVLPVSTGAKSTPAQGDITRVINNNRAGIQTCYQRALMRDNTLKHGKVNVRLTVGLSGRVKKVGIEATTQFRALEPCIREVVQRWAFPPSSEEYDTEFPFVLGAE